MAGAPDFGGTDVVVVGDATAVDVVVGTTVVGVAATVVVVVATGAVVDVVDVVDGVGPVGGRPAGVGGPESFALVRATTVARPELTGAATPFELVAMPPVAVPSTTRVPTATTARVWRPGRPSPSWCARAFRSLPIAPHFFRGAGQRTAMPRTAQLIRQPG